MHALRIRYNGSMEKLQHTYIATLHCITFLAPSVISYAYKLLRDVSFAVKWSTTKFLSSKISLAKLNWRKNALEMDRH